MTTDMRKLCAGEEGLVRVRYVSPLCGLTLNFADGWDSYLGLVLLFVWLFVLFACWFVLFLLFAFLFFSGVSHPSLLSHKSCETLSGRH